MIPFGVWVSSCSLSVARNDCPPPPIRHSGSRHRSLASIQSQDFLMTWSVSTPIRNHHWCALNSGFAPGSSTSIVSEVYVKIKLFSPSHFIETNNRISLFFRTNPEVLYHGNTTVPTSVPYIASLAFSTYYFPEKNCPRPSTKHLNTTNL